MPVDAVILSLHLLTSKSCLPRHGSGNPADASRTMYDVSIGLPLSIQDYLVPTNYDGSGRARVASRHPVSRSRIRLRGIVRQMGTVACSVMHQCSQELPPRLHASRLLLIRGKRPTTSRGLSESSIKVCYPASRFCILPSPMTQVRRACGRHASPSRSEEVHDQLVYRSQVPRHVYIP